MKIFLGYPSEYEIIAWEVYDFLTAAGNDVWFDKTSLVAGTDWDKERDRGQREAELVVHLCSDAILKRPGVVNREIRQTLRLAEDQPLGSLYVIPIRLEPIKMPVELTRFQYFDFSDDWKGRLLEGIAKRRAQLFGSYMSEMPQPPRVIEEKPSLGLQKNEFQDVTAAYECRGEYLLYREKGLYWTFVNGALASESLRSFYSARHDFKTLSDESDVPDEDDRKHEWSISAEEFFRDGDIISARFYTYVGYAGAAHPNHYITTLNFFGKNFGTLSIEQLLDHSFESAQKVLTYCEKVILAEFEGELEQDSFFEGYKDSEEQVWKLLDQFNLDRQGMTFNFSPYDVLPYVFGSHEVHVPWRFIEPLLADGYGGIVEKLSMRT